MPRSRELHVRFYDISYGLWEELEKPMDAKILVLYSLQLLLFHVRFATSSRDTLARNQTIGDGEIIVSRENKFALGFFSPGNSTYRYLGIWYHGLPEQAVIWVANRNTPINGSSGILLLNQHGNLVLYSSHDQRVAVWSADVSVAVTETCMAQLLDSGNFVLSVQDASNIVWQSFDYPTNTMIRGMRFRINRKTGQEHFLTSWRSADDPGNGDYSLKLNPGGSPQFVLYKGTKDYWRSCPWPWRKYAFVYNYTFVNNPDEVFFADLQEDPSSLQRTVLDDTGLMKRLILDESTDGKWKVVWYAPMYRCHSYGRCGLYSECDAPSEGKFGCACLPGYEPNLERGRYLGDGEGSCVKKQQQSLMCEQGEGFVRVENVKVPDAQGGVWLGANVGLLACEQQCMSNFSCLAYAIADVAGRGHGCMVWYGKLMDSLEFSEEGYDLYACADALQLAESTRISHGVFQRKGMLAILVLSIVSAWIVIVIIAVLLLRKSRNRRAVRRKWSKRIFDANSLDQYKDTWVAKEFEHNESHPDLAFFDLSTILAATNNFSPYNKLGQGGFGSVYKGQLYNEQEVAVKRLSNSSGQGMEEFANEVTLIAKLQHRNLVKLLGYCIEGEEPMLIYEYLPNKSLDSFLFDDTRKTLLDWRKRSDIIFGIARGILYLHQDSRLRIIHRDLKTSNVLLDEEMNPKISDFGMARIFKDDQIQSKTRRVVGTYGYMSPEYAVFGRFSVKSDVFSFGVILFEIISGKKNSNFYQEDPAMSLIGYAWELWREERALEMVDLSLEESYPPREAMRCIQIGLLCVQEDAKDRPTMLDVVFMLNSDMPLPSPKQPAFIFRNCVNQMNLPVGDQEQQCSVNEITITTVLSR